MLTKETCYGQELTCIKDKDYHYCCGYYTANTWVNEDVLVLSRSKSNKIGCKYDEVLMDEDKRVELVLVSLTNGEETVLCKDVKGYANSVVYHGRLYYVTYNGELAEINTLDRNKRIIAEKLYGFEGPHISKNGEFISLFKIDDTQTTSFITVNVKTGEIQELLKKRFSDPFPNANHCMICPANPEMIFFAHEGTTQYISNRLWIAESDGTAKHIADQRLDPDGNLGECFGHEMWAPDGKGIYFVKYTVSTIPPKGICYVDVKTNGIKQIASAYPYWHVCVSPDGRFLVADTQTGKEYSEIISVDVETGAEQLIATVNISGSHPCHPHPQFSPDTQKICFTMLDCDGRTCVGITGNKCNS